MRCLRFAVFTLLALGLTGCAMHEAGVKRDQARLAAVHAAAGPAISSFIYPDYGLFSWEPLSTSELLVYTRPTRAYLLNVGMCPDLPWTTAIGITTHVGSVNTLTDSVVPDRSDFPCQIIKIQPVDVGQLRDKPYKREGAHDLPAAASSS